MLLRATAYRGEREPGDAESFRDGATDEADRAESTVGPARARPTDELNGHHSTTDPADEAVARDRLVGAALA